MSECVSGLFMFTSHFSHSSRFFGRHFWVCHSLLSTHTYCWLQTTTHSHSDLYSYSWHNSILYVILQCSGHLPSRCHFKATCNALSEVIFPVKQPEVKCPQRYSHFRTVRSKLRNKLVCSDSLSLGHHHLFMSLWLLVESYHINLTSKDAHTETAYAELWRKLSRFLQNWNTQHSQSSTNLRSLVCLYFKHCSEFDYAFIYPSV